MTSQEPWTGVTYGGNWSRYDGNYANADYRKDQNGRVHLRGLIKPTATPSSGQLMFSLPSGYQPTHYVIFPLATSTGYGQLYVNGSGNFLWSSGSTGGGWVSLEGISFATT